MNSSVKHFFLIFALINKGFCKHLVVDFENPIDFEKLYQRLATRPDIKSILRMDKLTRSELCESILKSKFFSTKGVAPASKHKRQLQKTARFYLRDDYELHFLPAKKAGRSIRSIYLVIDHTVVMPPSRPHVLPLLPCLGIAKKTSALQEYFVSDGLDGNYHFIFHRNAIGSIVPVAMTERKPLEEFANSPAEKLERFYADQRRLFDDMPAADISTFSDKQKFKITQLIFQSFSYIENSVTVHEGTEERRIQFMTSGYESMNWFVNVIRCTIEEREHKSTRFIGSGFVKNSFFSFRNGDKNQIIIDAYFSDVIVLE